MKNNLPDPEEVAVTLIPPGQARQVAFQYGWGFYVSATSSHTDEAWQFLEWLSSRMGREVSPLGEALATLGSLPVNRQDLRSSVFAADARIYEGFIENLNMAVQEPLYPEGERRQAIFGTEISKAINLEKTPAQALADAARQMQAILDQYRN
jgi:ABC-type glycerol-3-phosphate transport system substrate-binding protein